MRTARIVMSGLAYILATMFAMPSEGLAQVSDTPVQGPEPAVRDAEAPEQAENFTREELTQMLAPIALYPDSLIAEILMASTYPLEIVEAERWLRNNRQLKDDALNEALKDKTWDPSVKSLCHFPDVLFALSDKLDQTRKLGDAFLGQQEEVMATIQELRRRARDQGTLKDTREQKVVIEREIIQIEPADPKVIYVPVYDPLYAYGPWWYPAYPPYYWYYPPGFVSTGFFFGPHVFFGVGFFHWGWFDWHHHVIIVDFHKTRKFHKHRFRRGFDKPHSWRHDYSHRRGVAYRDRRTFDRFGQGPSRRSVTSPEVRGFPPRGERRAVEPSRGPGGRRDRVEPSRGPGERRDRVEPSRGSGERRDRVEPSRGPGERRDRVEPSRGPGERRDRVEPRGGQGREQIQREPRVDTPFRGVGEGGFERRAGERGRESRGGEMRLPGGDRGRQGGDFRQRGGGGGSRGDGGSRGGGSRGGGGRR